MVSLFKKLYALFDRQERRQAKGVFVLMLGAALVEVVGVASILPFVAVLANPEVVNTNPFLNTLYTRLAFEDPASFMQVLGFFVLLLFLGSLALKAGSAYTVLRFSNMRFHSLAFRLLGSYLSQPYEFFLSRNTADLTKSLFSEVTEVVDGVLLPFLKFVSGSLVAILISVLLFIVEPWLTVAVGLVLGGSLGVIYYISRRLLSRLGSDRVKANQDRFRMANEALNGIKELRLAGRTANYLSRFENASRAYAKYQATNKIIGDLPHFAVQGIAFGGVLVLVLYLMGRQGGFDEATPLIALYAFAGYRLLPAFQQIFKNGTSLRFYSAGLDSLHHELIELGRHVPIAAGTHEQPKGRIGGDICLRGVTYYYPSTPTPALDNLSLEIGKGACVAFVGSTGSGKSTLIDLMLGLLEPSVGTIFVGAKELKGENLRAWQNNIGYVPQSIYLADATVAENIAFGIPPELIDRAAVERAAVAAHIHDFVTSKLTGGYDASIGERGVRLSGGQRQRIGIARALYHDPDVVVFDEATSALDNATEAAVMEAVNELAGLKTIILIAHRLSTVKSCDAIFMLENGKLTGDGTFEELIKHNAAFGLLAAGKA